MNVCVTGILQPHIPCVASIVLCVNHNLRQSLSMKNASFPKRTLAAAAVTLALASGHASAQDAFTGWTGTASAGATFTRGNAESDNINASIRLIKSSAKWDHVLFASLFRGTSTILVTERDEDGNVVLDDNGFPQRSIVEGDNSDRLTLGYQPKYYFSNKLYGFGLFDWETDEPANIDSTTRQIIGVGYSFYRNASGYLSGEIGIGNKTLEPVIGDDLDGGIGYLGLNYLNRISETVTLNADLRSDFGSDNTFVEIGVGAAVKVSTNFSVKGSLFSRSNTDLSDPGNPLDSDSDTIATVSLVLDI